MNNHTCGVEIAAPTTGSTTRWYYDPQYCFGSNALWHARSLSVIEFDKKQLGAERVKKKKWSQMWARNWPVLARHQLFWHYVKSSGQLLAFSAFEAP